MMTDQEIRDAIAKQEIVLNPLDESKIEPASYDARVGIWAFASSLREKLNLGEKGMLIVEPGEFAVLECREVSSWIIAPQRSWDSVPNMLREVY